MYVTTEVFLWVNGAIMAILLCLLGFLWNMKFDIAPLSSLAKRIQLRAVDDWFEKRGLFGNSIEQKKSGNANNHSLPPEKAMERDSLIAIGRERWLTQSEAARLRELLQEDARDDFTKGVLGVLAFAAIMIGIGAIIKSLSQE